MATILNDKIIDKKQVFDAWHLIQNAQSITLLTHDRPDGDGISACAVFAHILEKQNKKIETIYPCNPDLNFVRHPKNILINTHKQVPDLIIAFDTANYERLYFPDIFKNIPLINIDHHISNSIRGRVDLVYSSHTSTCESIFLILETINSKLIDTYVAECLLVGILYDSLTFYAQTTTACTLRITAQLIDAGANISQIETELLSNKTPQIIALWGKFMGTIQESKTGTAAWVVVTQQDLKESNVTQTALAGFCNFLSQNCKTDIIILFYETDNGKTKISLRSKIADVNKLAAKFGGGGHQNAAGLLINEPLNNVVKKITALI